MSATRVGFVGLGVMGAPMAGHLLAKGQDVLVWNRTAAKPEPLRGQGAAVAADLAEVGRSCEIVFLCVTKSEDVQACVAGLAATAAPGSLFVDHSTISPKVAQEIARDLEGRGLHFMDAPITGGSMGAQKGQLTIFCGGRNEDFERGRPYMEAYGKRVAHVGEHGAGQLTKMANQIAVGAALLGLCETLSFAQKAGLDLALTRELIAGGAGGSWAFENYGPKILDRDWTPGFSVANQRKDFVYCREAAASVDAALPGTDLVDRLLAILDERGQGELTTAALYDVMLEMKAPS